MASTQQTSTCANSEANWPAETSLQTSPLKSEAKSGGLPDVALAALSRERSGSKCLIQLPAFAQMAPARHTSLLSRFEAKYGGGGGNRTRVREPSDRASTYIACELDSPFQAPAGKIPEELAYRGFAPHPISIGEGLSCFSDIPSRPTGKNGRDAGCP